MNKLMVLPLAALTVACGDFEPLEGNWEMVSSNVVDDGCGLEEEESGEGEESDDDYMTLELTDDGFTLEGGGDSPAWECTTIGKEFACDDLTDELDLGELSEGAIEGLATFVVGIVGAFSDDASGELEQSVSVTCEGSGCEMAEIPESCTSTLISEVAWVDSE